MATARVRCVSGEIAPKDMAWVLNRLRIDASDSTWPRGRGSPGTISKSSLTIVERPIRAFALRNAFATGPRYRWATPGYRATPGASTGKGNTDQAPAAINRTT